MIGGIRCGKTTALASLFEQIKNGIARDYFVVTDATLELYNGQWIGRSLADKILELQNFMETNRNNSNLFVLDTSPNHCFNEYSLRLTEPGRISRKIDIEFTDTAGSFWGVHDSELEEKVKEHDVIVIGIDTPYLMGSVGEDTKDLCPEYINLAVNKEREIQNLLTCIHDEEKAKMVVFVPLKCEKWAKEPDGLSRVNERVKEVYATLITNLSAYSKMNISIIPMQSIGNIIFSEFQKAYIYNDINGRPHRCCMIDDEIIRIENGEYIIPKQGETITENPEAIIAGTHLSRPYAWYQINPYDSRYAPKNCDQLLFHILRFIVYAYAVGEKEKYKFPSILPPRNKYQNWIGSYDYEVLKNIVGRLVVDKDDGIEIIRNF